MELGLGGDKILLGVGVVLLCECGDGMGGGYGEGDCIVCGGVRVWNVV